MSSKNKKVSAGPRHRNPLSRAQLFPKKVLNELLTWDIQMAVARKQIQEAFPDPVERLKYLNSLVEAMDEPSKEISEDEGVGDAEDVI